MPTWFDLPAEVKQIIFSYVPESEYIIYVPRDKRRTVDLKHLESHHFHNLLLVSKNFITPDDFAFAVLARASLVFRSFYQQRRFFTEVTPAVREAVRTILLVRHIHTASFVALTRWYDSFEGFSNISATLSTQFPHLKQINVAAYPYCARIGYFVGSEPPSRTQFDRMVAFILRSADKSALLMEQDPNLVAHAWILPIIVAGFIANRNTIRHEIAWIRPASWLRRLVQYAEEASIEVIFHVKLCLCASIEPREPEGPDTVPLTSTDECFPHRNRINRYPRTWLVHIDSSMSTKDYLLRVEHDGVEHRFHQKLAYDMLHAPASKGDPWWIALLTEHGYHPNWGHPGA